jgi:hypothetical protein
MLSQWFADPFEEMRALQRQLNSVFDSYMRDIRPSTATSGTSSSSSSEVVTWRPSIDVKEDDKKITIHAELPGVPKENINIDFENGLLTIRYVYAFFVFSMNERKRKPHLLGVFPFSLLALAEHGGCADTSLL